MKRDQGKVETLSVPVSTGAGGPSIPDPVVHPFPVAALNTKPMAASYHYPNKHKSSALYTPDKSQILMQITLERGDRAMELLENGALIASDRRSASFSLFLQLIENRRGLVKRLRFGEGTLRGETEEVLIIRVSMAMIE